MNRYEIANLRRQAILDVIVAHPDATLRDVRLMVVGVEQCDVGKTMTRMERRGEITCTGKILVDGFRMRTYRTLRETCIPADECVRVMTDKMLATQGKKPRKDDDERDDGKRYGYIEPGRYVHKPQSLPPVSGGQGGCHKPRMCSRMMG